MTDPVQEWMDAVRSKARGRTRFEGQGIFPDEAVLAEIESLRSQLSDRTVAREQLEGQLAEMRKQWDAACKRVGEEHNARLTAETDLSLLNDDYKNLLIDVRRLRERATAAEAALAEAVKEHDAMLNGVRAAEAFHTYLTRTKVKYRDGTNLNLKATPPFERFDAAIRAWKDTTC